MRHFALLILLCLFPVFIMGEAATDSTATSREHTPDTTAVVNAQTDSLGCSFADMSKRQNSQEKGLLAAYACIVVLAIMVILLTVKLARVSAKRKQLRSDFEQFKQATLAQTHVGLLEKKIHEDVDRKISQALKIVGQVDNVRDSRQRSAPSMAPALHGSPVIRFFETNSGCYFVEVSKEPSPCTAFKVTFENDSLDMGEFELTDLNIIKSADQNEKVIQLVEGSKKIDAATQIISQVKGKVVKSGGRWEVKEKLRLKLS
jgi:hypothetical protein